MDLIQKKNEDTATQMIEYENKKELMAKLEAIVWPIDTNLYRLIDLLDRCKFNWSWQALQVELDIIKYIDSLRGIRPDAQKKSLTVSLFSYSSDWSRTGIKADLEY